MIAPGALVLRRQTGAVAWVVHSRMADGRFKCISKGVDRVGHQLFSSRTAGPNEIVLVRDAPTYEAGTTVEHNGKSYTVASDNGDSLTLIVPVTRRPLRSGGYLRLAAGNLTTVSKSDLTLETLR